MNKELAFIGLGKMGGAMSAHLVEKGFTVHGYDADEEARQGSQTQGVTVHNTVEETINALSGDEKIIWLMVPARFVDEVITKIKPLLTPNDIVIDGGNSFFKDTIARNDELADAGIEYVDCGTSGGVDGARKGASLMIGADKHIFAKTEHIFKALALPNGYGHVGEVGAGHFVKMVHNGIEYGMMGRIDEGMNILHEHKDALNLNIQETLKPFENGSVIESSLISWLAGAYKVDGYLEHIAGCVPVGETEMEMEYLIENENVLVLDAAVKQRKLSREEPTFIGTLIAAMRNQFGGHRIVPRTQKQHENKRD